ncbi:MAG: hypothetical protein WCO56_03785 [Verrucomicrobiota bacterium]
MKIIFTCALQGDNFRPTEAEKELGIVFVEKNEAGEHGRCGRYIGKPQPFGFGAFECETDNESLEIRALGFLNRVHQCLPVWKKFGAEIVTLRIDVIYDEQCNFEISESIIAQLHELQLPVAISCYCEMRNDNGKGGIKTMT